MLFDRRARDPTPGLRSCDLLHVIRYYVILGHRHVILGHV